MTYQDIMIQLNGYSPKSFWDDGIWSYANAILESVDNDKFYESIPGTREELEKVLLDGFNTWEEYSDNGMSLTIDDDIMDRLCGTTSLIYREDDVKRANKAHIIMTTTKVDWMSIQVKALYQAFDMIARNAGF